MRDLLLTHELIFIALILLAVLGGAYGIHLWDKSAQESQRIHVLVQEIQQTRGDLYRQMKELFDAYFLNDQDARSEYRAYTNSILKHFDTLEQLAVGSAEIKAIATLKKNYTIFKEDAPNMFHRYQISPTEASRKALYLDMETGIFSNYEAVSKRTEALLALKQEELKERLDEAKQAAILILSIPILLAGLLLFLSRTLLKREIVKPIQSIMLATAEISAGKLQHKVPTTGAAELAKLAEEINAMADDLARSRDALVKSEKQAALGLLVPMLAHNIRNPLSSIRATAQVIEIPAHDEEMQESIKGIINTVDRLERWTGALLAYLHPVKPKLNAVSIETIFSNALVPLTARLHEKKIGVTQQIAEGLSSVLTDEHLLEQVIYNLVLNALEASPPHSQIMIDATLDSFMLKISIRDEGSGMPFKPNPRLDSPGPTTKRFGTGLGIPFVFKVCEVLGGNVEFSANHPRGTVVQLQFLQANAPFQVSWGRIPRIIITN